MYPKVQQIFSRVWQTRSEQDLGQISQPVPLAYHTIEEITPNGQQYQLLRNQIATINSKKVGNEFQIPTPKRVAWEVGWGCWQRPSASVAALARDGAAAELAMRAERDQRARVARADSGGNFSSGGGGASCAEPLGCP